MYTLAGKTGAKKKKAIAMATTAPNTIAFLARSILPMFLARKLSLALRTRRVLSRSID